MLLPNYCSSVAHQRIHQGSQPHVCPECGLTLKQPLFQKHLYETCLHFSRRVGYRYSFLLYASVGSSPAFRTSTFAHTSSYRCSSCLVVFGGLNSVKSHIQQAHCDVFHKCPSCPMAFKSAPSVQSHITAQHPDATEGQTLYMKHILHVVSSNFSFRQTNQGSYSFAG